MKNYRKYLILLIAFLLPALAMAIETKHPVEITVKDLNRYDVSGLEFTIKDKDGKLIEKGKTNEKGFYETTLFKGHEYEINFFKLEEPVAYVFKVPGNTRLRKYKLLCRLPIQLVEETAEMKAAREKILENAKSTDCTIILQNKDRVLLADHKFKLFDSDSTIIKEALTDSEGKFQANLKEGRPYFVLTNVYGEDYTDDFYVAPNAQVYTFRLILPFPSKYHGEPGEDVVDAYSIGKKSTPGNPLAQKAKGKRVFILKNINFASGKYDLKPSSFPSLDKLVTELKSKPTMIIQIAGHTDSVGDADKNMVLSQNRAKAIVNYLVDHGISPDRLSFIGYGEDQPIASNKTARGRAENRRSEVHVISE